jgi:hypothetical protein
MTNSEERETLETLALRVSDLESRLRTLKRAAALPLAIVALGALVGASGAVQAPDVLSARSFQLVDDRGRVVGRWASAQGVVRLEALNVAGELVAGIELADAEPHARVIAPGGKQAPANGVLRETAPAPAANAPRDGAGVRPATPSKDTGDGAKGDEEKEDPFDWVE